MRAKEKKTAAADKKIAAEAHADGHGSYVMLDTPVVDEKGNVVGTEPRRYNLLRCGRNLIVEEEGSSIVPTQKDKEDLHKFLHLAKSSPLQAAMLVSQKSTDDMARFRKQYRIEAKEIILIDLVKQSFPLALANWVSTCVYPLPEFLADEIHLATMGLSDNHSAMVDALCSSPGFLVRQIAHFYGVKFGDGRYEASDKSADGKGDSEKLFRDVKFSISGPIQELLLARIRGESGNVICGSDAMEALKSGDWNRIVAVLTCPSEETLDLVRKNDSMESVAESVAPNDDKTVSRACFACLASPEEFWSVRLRECIAKSPINKKLLVRIVACNSPQQRAALVMRVPQAKAMLEKGDSDEAKFLRALFLQ